MWITNGEVLKCVQINFLVQWKKYKHCNISFCIFSFSSPKFPFFNSLSTKRIISKSFLSFVAKHGHVIQIKKNTVRENWVLIHATT